jgi:hypothetical protein
LMMSGDEDGMRSLQALQIALNEQCLSGVAIAGHENSGQRRIAVASHLLNKIAQQATFIVIGCGTLPCSKSAWFKLLLHYQGLCISAGSCALLRVTLAS